ncbi:hypothetical protein HDU96_005578 [Phlyctochytrium bullatum]|nr:hypothetical protein HDU96_005578 [Phlyctochytrium bullatum]
MADCKKDVEKPTSTVSLSTTVASETSPALLILDAGSGSDAASTGDRGGAHGLRRHLKARHLGMIAIGGTIGTGLFLGSGKAIAEAGPVGVMIAYAVTGAGVWSVVTSLGEMATQFPVAGAFSQLGTRFLGPAAGFTLGWNYWLQWAITLPAELVACGTIMAFWAPNVPEYVWSFAFLVPLVVVNAFGVKGFGEVEFVLSLIKVIAIVVFLVLGVVVVCGGSALGAVGFQNWVKYPVIAPDTAGMDGMPVWFRQFLAVMVSFPVAMYSYGGTELVGLTAGEAANPRKSVPRAISGTFWRIALFYIGALFLVGLIVPYTDPRLQVGDVQSSPFTLVYSYSGIAVAAHVMNAVILVAVLSAANSSIYACSRTLMGLAAEGKAPRFLARVNRRGVPVWSLGISVGFGCLAFLGSLWGNAVVFNLLSSIIALAILASWMMINVIHLRFRAAWVAQGRKLSDLHYRAPLHPYGDYMGLGVGTIVVGFLVYQACLVPFDPIATAQFYVGIPAMILLWVGYSWYPWVVNTVWYGGRQVVDPRLGRIVPLLEIDFETDRLVVDPAAEEAEAEEERRWKEAKGWGRVVYVAKKAWEGLVG